MEPNSKKPSHPDRRVVYPRKRANAACTVCRSRRTKCDNRKPRCSFCERVGADCVTLQNDPSTFDPASLDIIGRLERIESLLATQAPSGPVDGIAGRGVNDDRARTIEVEEELLFPQTLRDVLRWPVLAPHVLSASERVKEPSPLTSPYRDVSTPKSTSIGTDLDMKHCTALMDDYFSFSHIKNPIVDEAALRAMVKRICFEGFAWDADSCLALLVLANGAISTSFGSRPSRVADDSNESAERLSDGLFRAAQKRIGLALGGKCLIQAQCFFLSGVYLMCKLRAHEAWQVFLQALAACQGFRCVTRTETTELDMSDAEGAMEERVYWSSWKSEREVRLELGLRDFAAPNLEHPDLYPSLPQGYEDKHLRSWYFYLSEIAIWRLRNNANHAMARYREASGIENLVELSEDLEHQVEGWQQSLPPTIALGTLDCAASETDILQYVLRGAITNYYEMIMWPFIVAVINWNSQSETVRACAAKGLRWHMNRLIINSPGFRHRHHGTWLMQQSSSRSAFILFAAALTPGNSALLPDGWLRMVDTTIEMLIYWSPDVSDLPDRIRVLQTLRAKFTDTQ